MKSSEVFVKFHDTDLISCYAMTISGQVMSLNIGQIFQMTFKDKLAIHSKRFDKRNEEAGKINFMQVLS